MRSNRHRKNKIKQQHGIIKGLKKFLEKEISPLDFIKSITPGQIRVGKAKGEVLAIRFQYATSTGAKLIARSGTSVQEVFVVTAEPEKLKKKIENTKEWLMNLK